VPNVTEYKHGDATIRRVGFVYVSVYCGCCAGPYQWFGDVFDCPECTWEETILVPEEEWEDCGENLLLTCPSCHNPLEDDCHYELIEEPTETEIKEAVDLETIDEQQTHLKQENAR
jgi:hypothetical protein